MACKRLFDVASSLIADHQTCKELVQRGQSRFAQGKTRTDHFVIHDAFDFLDDLSSLLTALQLDALQYFKRVTFFSQFIGSETRRAILEHITHEYPILKAALLAAGH